MISGRLGAKVRDNPSLVIDGVPTPIEFDPKSRILADGDDLYVLSFPDMSESGQAKARATRVRSLDGTVDTVANNSCPSDWNFIARTGGTIVLTGARRIDGPTKHPMAAVLHADGRGYLVDPELIGNARRLQNDTLVECALPDRRPGFAWFYDSATVRFGYKKFPLYGDIKEIVQTDANTLHGWHVEGDTLFLSRYSRD